MTRRPDLVGRLHAVRKRIAFVRFIAKRSVGPRKEDWPEALRARYDDLRAKARMIQGRLEEGKAA